MQADLQLHNAMWAEFNSFTEMRAVSVDKISTQWEEGFQIQLKKNPDRTMIFMTGECSII